MSFQVNGFKHSCRDNHKDNATIQVEYRCILGKQLVVLVDGNKEYVALDTLRLTLFSHIPIMTFLNIVSVVGICLMDVEMISRHQRERSRINQYFVTTSKMVQFKDVFHIVLHVGMLLDPTTYHQMGQMFPVHYYNMHIHNQQYFNMLSTLSIPSGVQGNNINKRINTEKVTESNENVSTSQCSSNSTMSTGRQQKKRRLMDTVEKLHYNKHLRK